MEPKWSPSGAKNRSQIHSEVDEPTHCFLGRFQMALRYGEGTRKASKTVFIRTHIELDTLVTREHVFYKALCLPREKQRILQSGDVEIEYTSSGTNFKNDFVSQPRT